MYQVCDIFCLISKLNEDHTQYSFHECSFIYYYNECLTIQVPFILALVLLNQKHRSFENKHYFRLDIFYDCVLFNLKNIIENNYNLVA